MVGLMLVFVGMGMMFVVVFVLVFFDWLKLCVVVM